MKKERPKMREKSFISRGAFSPQIIWIRLGFTNIDLFIKPK